MSDPVAEGLRLFTVWRHDECLTLAPGFEVPAFADGSPMHGRNDVVAQIYARDWDEAKRAYDRLLDEGKL